MTLQLVVLQAALAFALLFGVSMTLFWVLAQNIERDEALALVREIEEIGSLLRDPERNRALLERVLNRTGRPGQTFYHTSFARLRSPAGAVWMHTSGMTQRLPEAAFPAPAERAETELARRWSDAAGHPYLLMAVAFPAPARPSAETAENAWVVQAAIDLSRDMELIRDYRNKMVALLLLGIALAVGIGVPATHHAMRPLREITALVRRINAERLHKRVEPARWPRELADLAAAFDAMLERLESSFLRLRRFSADLAHELRTPVNALMGEAEVALSRPRGEEEYRQVLGSALEEYGRLARLIDNLLFLARAEDAGASLERKALDAAWELEAVRAFYEAVAEERGVEVSHRGGGSVRADPILFRRALSNLLSNALRHTPAGGRIVLAAEAPRDGFVTISVADTGEGVEAGQIPHLFERFYRADTARRRHDGGAGLGLAIVASIMTLHGGGVEMHSRPGCGTTVRLRFPV